jgi:hypothetical protein
MEFGVLMDARSCDRLCNQQIRIRPRGGMFVGPWVMGDKLFYATGTCASTMPMIRRPEFPAGPENVEHTVAIRDGHEGLGELSLDTNGFVLSPHATAAKDFLRS